MRIITPNLYVYSSVEECASKLKELEALAKPFLKATGKHKTDISISSIEDHFYLVFQIVLKSYKPNEEVLIAKQRAWSKVINSVVEA